MPFFCCADIDKKRFACYNIWYIIFFKDFIMTDVELTKKIFAYDQFVKKIGAEILELDAEKAVVRAPITEDCFNANGSAQGGMLYTLADFAFAVHANLIHPVTVTQCGHIDYVRAAKPPYVTATAREKVRAGHNTVSEVILRDGAGEIVCVCTFNGFVKDVDRAVLAEKFR